MSIAAGAITTHTHITVDSAHGNDSTNVLEKNTQRSWRMSWRGFKQYVVTH